MAASEFLTWDGDDDTPPRRPGVEDVGGDKKIDDDRHPPDPVIHPTAGGWNEKARQIPALARVSASAKLKVEFASGTSVLAQCAAASMKVSPQIFTVTDNGIGDTTVTWPAETFPAAVCSPTGLTVFHTTIAYGVCEEVTNGIRVRTFDAAGA